MKATPKNKLKQDRFLLAILGAIGLLVVLAVGLFFTRRVPQEYVPDDTPQGVVRNYVLALEQGDYQRAYGYLQDSDNKPDFERFRTDFLTRQLDPKNTALQIGESQQTGEVAVVELVVIRGGGRRPFGGNVYRESTNALLVQDTAGKWVITELPYPYWGWEWYSRPIEVPAPRFPYP